MALAAVVIYPDLGDRELGYPLLMLDDLPSIIMGLVVASFIAAFMSTVSTDVHCGWLSFVPILHGLGFPSGGCWGRLLAASTQ